MRKLIITGITLLLTFLAFTVLLAPCSGVSENSWVPKANLTYARSGSCAAVVGEKIYIFGGVGEKGYCTITEQYDPINNVWTTKTPIPTHRSHFGVAVWEDKIYCIGGQDIKDPFAYREQSTGKNEVYDPKTDSWKTLAPMPNAQLSIQANTVNGKIYVMGGYINDTTASDLNQVYDLKTNSWSTRTPMPKGQHDHTSAVIDKKIYIFSTNSTQIYDTYYDSWQIGASAPLPIIMGNAITTSGPDGLRRIFVFAANMMPWLNSTRKELTTQCYNPETDSWTTGTSVPTCRYYAAVANINETIYVMGGFTTPLTNGQVSYVDCTVNEQYTPFDFASPTVSVQSSAYDFGQFIWIVLLLIGIIVVSIGLIVYLKKK